MNGIINKAQFKSIQKLMETHTGIHLGEHKRVMVESRLKTRLPYRDCTTFDDYIQLLYTPKNGEELDYFIDRLTTHETRFFRESQQFEQLSDVIQEWPTSAPIRVWSAACSTGEEVYSLAMVLDQSLGARQWSITGSDISQAAVTQAKACQYDISLVGQIPTELKRAYCLKGVGEFDGYFTISNQLRRRCHFIKQNLLSPKFDQPFHAIFLRNVLIYFDVEKQNQIVDGVINQLHHGGYLFLGHSENVLKQHPKMRFVDNCVYRKESA
ncbi:protein-glutamate O-methyltransferase CheR [Vibrio aquaticus]|uniref:Chemotaxis protein methyltransferase n=1 Tax=Vibrio aquaticus TaxID=2496559 RepID=A0A432CXD7_9VIBR|nr:CheR family methyltransferase [Vibrio aquaticus]RTZ16580.1 protein-glutamate O-methyltransferase CheR [Vibrio aquaticus]